jgi:hypothetical protein
MKKLIFLFIIMFTFSLYSQTIKIISVDASKYPKMKAEFTVEDATKKELREVVLPADLILKDGGKVKTITNKFCEVGKFKFSLVLTLDKSGSMLDDINANAAQAPNRRIDAAMFSAKALVDALPGYPNDPLADIALTAFSAGPISNVPFFRPHDILKWFTYNQDSVKKEIDLIKPVGATDYNVAFLGNKNQNILGIMDLCDAAKYKPVVIFLTDGEHNPPAPVKPVDVGGIIARAKASGTTVFAVTLGLDVTPELASITSQTGGQAYGNLKDGDQISGIYFDILSKVTNFGKLSPCTIEWDATCDGGVLDLSITKPFAASATFSYNVDPTVKPDLDITPRNFTILNTAKGVTTSQNVVLKALKNNITFDALPVSADPRFVIDLKGKTIPFTILKGDSLKITINYTPTDTSCITSNITFGSTACTGNVMTASGGFIFAEDINCGFTPKGTPSLKTYTKKFCNYSCVSVTITGVQKGGANGNEFVFKNSPANLLVPSGTCVPLTIEFTPTDVTQRVGTFLVKTDKGDFSANMSGSGSGLADIQVNPTFNATNISCLNPSSTITIPVSNPGALDLFITNVSTDNTDFVVSPTTKIFTVSPGLSKNIVVVYSSATNGPATANLTIFSNADAKAAVIVALTGRKDDIALQYVENVDVDFGILCPNEVATKIVNIKNIGNITSNVISTKTKTEFKNTTADGTYIAGEIKPNTLQFTSAKDGNYTDILTFRDECGVVYNINMKAKVETPLVTSPAINITTTIGAPKTVQITLSNATSRLITVSSAKFIDALNVTIAELTIVPTTFDVPANGSKIVDVTYTPTPTNPNVVTGVLELTGTLPCASTSTITSIGNPDKAVATLGMLMTNTGYLGQDVVIPVFLKSKTRFAESKAVSVTANISFDATLLKPIGTTPLGTVTGGIRTIPVTFPSDKSNNDEVLSNLNFNVLSTATVTSTDLTITPTPKTDNNAVNIIIENGKFNLSTSVATLSLIKAADFHQEPGATIAFPINLIDPNGSLKAFNQGIKTQVRFNGTVLESVGIPSKQGVGNERIIDIVKNIVFPVASNVKDNSPQAPITYPIQTITFRAMLGTEVNTRVIVENADVITGKVLVNPDSVMFTLDGVCISGGIRLFDPTKTEFQLNQINPNPINGITSIEYHILELGNHKMFVIDMLGNQVLEIFNDNFKEGNYSTKFDASTLPSGAYRIILQSPTEIKSQIVQVMK